MFHDRDYHVHLGGAIPPSLISEWIDAGHLNMDDIIPDLVVAPEGSVHPTISVRDALIKYRGVDQLIDTNNLLSTSPSFKENQIYLSSYNKPQYTSLPTFLTMYRAFSKRHLLHQYASTIARSGKYVHPFADIRVSLPVPDEDDSDNVFESYKGYAQRALDEMIHLNSCLLPTQKLFITFPRQTFNVNKNLNYFTAFIELLSSSMQNKTNSIPWSETEQPAFDFSGQPLPLSQTVTLLSTLRWTFPSSFICYHHGEVCPHIPFSDRVKDTFELIPYVDRVGHGLCLGLAVLGIDPDNNVDSNKARIEENRKIAKRCLDKMAERKIGIEVSPTCSITLGGARDGEVLRQYVTKFLETGVNLFVGTDDPGFLDTTLEDEIAHLHGIQEEEF